MQYASLVQGMDAPPNSVSTTAPTWALQVTGPASRIGLSYSEQQEAQVVSLVAWNPPLPMTNTTRENDRQLNDITKCDRPQKTSSKRPQ